GALTIVIDTAPPVVSLTSAPASQTTDTSASFAFGATDTVTPAAGLLLQYSLDGGALAPAASPVALSGLAVGPHTFLVKATDRAADRRRRHGAGRLADQCARLADDRHLGLLRLRRHRRGHEGRRPCVPVQPRCRPADVGEQPGQPRGAGARAPHLRRDGHRPG